MKTRSNPTKRQSEVLKAIADFTDEHGFAPTIRELMPVLEITSTNGVVCHLKALETKGLLTWNPCQARTIRIVKHES